MGLSYLTKKLSIVVILCSVYGTVTLTRSPSRIMPSTGDYRESKDALDKATTGIFRPIEGPAEFLRCEPVFHFQTFSDKINFNIYISDSEDR